MKAIVQDIKINRLAARCEALAREIGAYRPAATFVHAAIFAAQGEDRLRDEDGKPLVGAVELELLGQRDALLMAACKARGVKLKDRHLDRIAREYGNDLAP